MQATAYNDLVDMLEVRASKSRDEIAYTFLYYEGDTRTAVNLTFGEVYDKARAIAVRLWKSGLKRGDRVIVFSSQTHDNIFAVYAALLAGATFTIIPPPIDDSKRQRFRSVLESSKPRFILCGAAIAKRLEDSILPKRLPRWAGRALVKAAKGFSIVDIDACTADPDAWSKPKIEPDALAYIQYSSGSTSAPKGVMVSHGNVLANLKSLNEYFGDHRPKAGVAWAPFFHNLGLLGIIFLNVHNGSRSVVISPVAFLEKPIRWFQAISDFKGDMTMGPDSAFRFCASVVDDAQLAGVDLSSMRYAVNGSEPINVSTLDAFIGKFGKCGWKYDAITPGYGLAEATCIVTAGLRPVSTAVSVADLKQNKVVPGAPGGDANTTKVCVSAGRIVNGLKALIVNPETMRECAPDQIGEIWLQGGNIAKGYWGLDQATADTFRGRIAGHDGDFLRTGDLGFIQNGDVYITGRWKDLIVINGHNLYPHDIELQVKEQVPALAPFPILSFPTVAPDSREVVVMCIEVPEGAQLPYPRLAKDIGDATTKLFGFFPYDVVFLRDGALPRTDNRKIQGNKSKAAWESGQLPVIFSAKAAKSGAAAARRIVKPANKIEEDVIAIFKSALKTEDELSTEDNFFMLGGDSMSIPVIADALEKQFGFAYPVKHFLEDPTIKGIAAYVEAKQKNPDFQLTRNAREVLLAECKLDEAIRPGAYPAIGDVLDPKNIFITGVTGFVGAHLVRDLMEATKADIYCLVRAKDLAQAKSRIAENMKSFECWNDRYSDRLKPVLGELTQPKLGIESGVYDHLTKTIDVIYNNGAMLNFVYPYAYLKDTNVLGTVECLRLACENKPKYFNHVSTFSVYDTPSYFERHVKEDDPLENPEGYFLGYSESKWVAEKMVQIAQSRGLKATVLRPGEITGAPGTGIWKMTDMVSRFIVACIHMRMVPLLQQKIHMTPVDYVSGAITALSLRADSYGHGFNIINKNVKTVPELVDIIKAFGYPLELIPFDDWKKLLVAADDNNALKLLQSLFFEEKPEREKIERRYSDLEAEHEVTNTLKGLNGTAVVCPPVDDKLVHTYLNGFIKLGYLPKPTPAVG